MHGNLSVVREGRGQWAVVDWSRGGQTAAINTVSLHKTEREARAVADRMEPQDDCPICGIRDGDCECPDEDRNQVYWPAQLSA